MGWPPEIGDALPRAAEALGVREKLTDYSLDVTHEDGGPKARGFERVLGITIADIDYLEVAIQEGVLRASIGSVRDNSPYGVNCVVDFPVGGRGEKSGRTVDVRTVWELTGAGAPPRLVTAYPRP